MRKRKDLKKGKIILPSHHSSFGLERIVIISPSLKLNSRDKEIRNKNKIYKNKNKNIENK